MSICFIVEYNFLNDNIDSHFSRPILSNVSCMQQLCNICGQSLLNGDHEVKSSFFRPVPNSFQDLSSPVSKKKTQEI